MNAPSCRLFSREKASLFALAQRCYIKPFSADEPADDGDIFIARIFSFSSEPPFRRAKANWSVCQRYTAK
jgi:hypothetical protein